MPSPEKGERSCVLGGSRSSSEETPSAYCPGSREKEKRPAKRAALELAAARRAGRNLTLLPPPKAADGAGGRREGGGFLPLESNPGIFCLLAGKRGGDFRGTWGTDEGVL